MLALAQLSRAFESRPSNRFRLSGLWDGSLENDADLILFLAVTEADAPGTANNPRLATISIAKHRNGPRADLDVCFLPGSTRFRDFHTLSLPLVPQQVPAATPTLVNPPMQHFSRLEEIMAKVTRGRPREGNAEPPRQTE